MRVRIIYPHAIDRGKDAKQRKTYGRAFSMSTNPVFIWLLCKEG